ncbi:DNA helicase PcrA [Fusibacter tunisiensis]|uniref:ATP-dependent DNA helicase n=1 Tax=Fusibacter tunisiensis TaxID=1008308 RepID=A0ABS2MSD8_9FIRM|nr:DNA helicase PcrA [Fusibacter tunisiensis]MBM7562326.1 DNA helicase-2/ATP-dependent DNA helicase PcrA [Fusibacter tunisiensis]
MDLNGLNTVQKEAVCAVDGPILVVAGAGSGKTRVLTYRIANLIETHDIFPSNILAITFTNKAASEMKSRIESLVGPVSNQMWIGTFHSICVRILRRDGEKIGYGSDFVIYDTTDQKSALKSCYKELNIDEKMTPLKTYQFKISGAKNDMLTPEAYEGLYGGDFREREFIKLYKRYQAKLKQNQAMDFDDLLLKTLELFQKHPDVLQMYQNKFKFIHVDEYQDTNRAQYELVKYLSGRYHNLFVVGDGDQSIYRWRGADIRNIQEFEKDYVGAKVYKLEQNYRSSQNILSLANSVIKNNPNRRDKMLWTDAAEGDKIQYYKAYDEKDEARNVIEQIKKQIRDSGYSLSDFAILYRTNAQSRAFEDMFMLEGIQYKVLGGAKFYDRKEIKDLMAYLKLIVNHQDDVSFLRVINEPKRSLGDRTIEKIQIYASANQMSLFDACGHAVEIEGISGKALQNIQAFYKMISGLRMRLESEFVTTLYDDLIEQSGIVRAYELEKTIEADGRIDNIYEFRVVVEEFEKRSENPNLRDFLAETSLVSDQDSLNDSDDAVLLMTIHASKGLEFPVVFLVGLEDQLFPSFRSMDDEEALEEERRLCYVGITRAEKCLHVSHAKNRNHFGRYEARIPSVFLKEMDAQLMEGKDGMPEIKTYGDKKTKTISFFDIQTPKKKSNLRSAAPQRVKAPENTAEHFSGYKAGDKVTHKTFGSGMVVSMDQAKDMITIVFDAHGIKKLSASMAPLKTVD